MSKSSAFKYLVPAIAALALLAGCDQLGQSGGGSSKDEKNKSPEVVKTDTITGNVTMRDPLPIGEGAKMEVKLVDLSQEEIPVAQMSEPVSGEPPYAYSLDVSKVTVIPTHTYEMRVLLVDGDRRFIPALISQVLTKGGGATADIVLKSEPTPGELRKEEIDKLQKQIGGMKTMRDSYLTDTQSVAWDAFYKDRQVRFIRWTTITEGKEPGNTSRNTVKYAYKDGKPLGVITGSTTYGWGENGELMVNMKSGGGEGDADAAKSYY
ncbi:MAG: YbaY family lipoprotein, partial [Dokdonella sp.]